MDDQPALRPSRKGWITAGFNRAIWIPCLPVFPSGHDRASWAGLYAARWWEASGVAHGPRQISGLRRSLEHLHELAYSELPCHMALIHLPSPRAVPLLVCFGVWEASGDRDGQLRLLAHLDEPGAITPPIVEVCQTRELGRGLKCLCYLPLEGSVVSGCLNYAWRSEELQTAVRVFTASPDLGRLQMAMPDIDDLMHVLSFAGTSR